ncbi:Glyoxylase B2 [Cyphellophora attinorum]|uniref:Glyoxylase B2 n=1 Tax=Cyphellophora attinorum TaxID=1664694 RepID=A0A0N0NHJ1_9EURO|nr:Glyoxylase B2 [Phialophora attinorum]KPI34329.1 Glyoxylase B2 [Phialophora attinorum]
MSLASVLASTPISTPPASPSREQSSPNRPRITIPPSSGGVVSVLSAGSKHSVARKPLRASREIGREQQQHSSPPSLQAFGPSPTQQDYQQRQYQQRHPDFDTLHSLITPPSNNTNFTTNNMTSSPDDSASTLYYTATTIPSPHSQPLSTVHAFPSRLSGTTVYIVVDPVTEEAAIINPILDLDPTTNEIRTRHADRLLKFVSDEGLSVRWVLETGIHVDRISACRYLQIQLEQRNALEGEGGKVVVGTAENSFCTCGDDDDDEDQAASPDTTRTASRTSTMSPTKLPEAFDRLFADGEHLRLGNIVFQCVHLDGHEGCEYIFGDNVFGSNLLKVLGGEMSNGQTSGRASVTNHPDPPPEKHQQHGRGDSTVSSRQKITIDEVLSSSATPSEQTNGDSSTINGVPQEPPRPSPMLAFYAEQVNTRGGRIPKKINLPAATQRRLTLSEGDLAGLDLNGKGKGRESLGGGGGQQQQQQQQGHQQGMVAPLKIPRKLGVIMC